MPGESTGRKLRLVSLEEVRDELRETLPEGIWAVLTLPTGGCLPRRNCCCVPGRL